MSKGKISKFTWFVVIGIAVICIAFFFATKWGKIENCSLAKDEIAKLKKAIMDNALVRKALRKSIDEDKSNKEKIENEIDNIFARFL